MPTSVFCSCGFSTNESSLLNNYPLYILFFFFCIYSYKGFLSSTLCDFLEWWKCSRSWSGWLHIYVGTYVVARKRAPNNVCALIPRTQWDRAWSFQFTELDQLEIQIQLSSLNLHKVNLQYAIGLIRKFMEVTATRRKQYGYFQCLVGQICCWSTKHTNHSSWVSWLISWASLPFRTCSVKRAPVNWESRYGQCGHLAIGKRWTTQ